MEQYLEQAVSPDKDKTGNNIASLISDEDAARSQTYAILAALLSAIPSADVIDYLRHIETLEQPQQAGEIGEAWQRLKQLADDCTTEQLDDEYHALFIGVGRGEIVPYSSFHITGFLMDKPLGELRADLATLGFEGDPDSKEPEDHVAAICETMAILITADDIEGFQHRRFYLRHIHPFAEKFFTELQSAKSAKFYRGVGLLGQRFIQIENQYLNIQEH